MNLKKVITFPFLLLIALIVGFYWFLITSIFCILYLPIMLIQGLWNKAFRVSFKEWLGLLFSFRFIVKSIMER